MSSTREKSVAGPSGQVVPLLCLALVVVAGLLVGLARLGSQAATRARAQTAADAAALAGAAEGEEAARSVAAANDGTLVEFVQAGALTEVEVRVGRATAVARAERLPSGWTGPAG